MKKAALLAVVAASTAVFLTALDQTVVVTALPQIIIDLQIPLNQFDRAAWIISGYLLGFVIAMPLMGRVSDLYGRRRVFIICLSIFAVGSLFCALAPVLGGSMDGGELTSLLQNLGIDASSPGLIWLVAARFVQAAGGGAVIPVAMAVAGDFYGEKHRGLALGLIGMVTEAGGVLGPLYGSVIVQYGGFSVPLGSSIEVSGWQTIFLLNLPIVAILLFLIWRFVPGSTSFGVKQARRATQSPGWRPTRIPSLLHTLLTIPGWSGASASRPTPTERSPGRRESLVPSVEAGVQGRTQGHAPTVGTGVGQDGEGELASVRASAQAGHEDAGNQQRRVRIDFVGALLFGASLLCLSTGLSQEAAQISPSTTTSGSIPIQNNPWLIAAALVLLAIFIAYEAFVERVSNREGRRVWPVVEVSMFKKINFSASALVSLLVGAALIIAMADIPIFIATVLGRPAIDSGLALLRLTAMIPIGALLGGWLCSLISCRLTAVLGLIPTAIGFWLMHLWPLNVGWTQITMSTIIGGLGFGLVIAPIGTTAINAASSRQIGMASSMVTVLRMVGMILGLAALTSWGLGRFRALAAAFHPPANVPVFSAQYNTLYGQYLIASAHEVYTAIFLAAGVLCIVALLPAFFLDGREPSPYLVRID